MDSELTYRVRHIQAKTSQILLQLLQSELSMAFTLYSVIETELRLGDIDGAYRALEKVQRGLQSLRYRLGEHEHRASPVDLDEIHRQLLQLESRISITQARLTRKNRSPA